MNKKIFFLIAALFVISFNVSAQLAGKKFQTSFEDQGIFNLAFSENNYELSDMAGNILLKGVYTIEQKTITFTDTEGPMSCPKDQKGKYEFLLDGQKLTLKLVEDECEGRPKIAATEWQQVKVKNDD